MGAGREETVWSALAFEIDASMKAVRDQIDRDYERAFRVLGVDGRSLRPSQGGSDPGDEQPRFIVAPGYNVRITGFGYDEQPTPCPAVKTFSLTAEQLAQLKNTPVDGDIVTREIIIPPRRPCYVCDAYTGVLRDGVPLCVGCR